MKNVIPLERCQSVTSPHCGLPSCDFLSMKLLLRIDKNFKPQIKISTELDFLQRVSFTMNLIENFQFLHINRNNNLNQNGETPHYKIKKAFFS